MTTRDPVDMLLSGRMDRRAFHQMLGALGLGLAVTPLVSRRPIVIVGYGARESMGDVIALAEVCMTNDFP